MCDISCTGAGPLSDQVILMMMEVYLQACMFDMGRLKHLCAHFLETCISHRNVLVALQNAARLNVDFLKVNSHTSPHSYIHV